MEALKQSHAVEVFWHAFELRPAGAPPMPPEYRERIEQSRPRLHRIAQEVYGIEMKPGPLGISSRAAHAGAKYAEGHGMGAAYHARVMRAYWEEAEDIGDRTVLGRLAAEAGMDRDEFVAALDDPAYLDEVLADQMQAARYGLSGVPALVFDNQYLVSGAQPPDVLRQVVDQIRSVPA